MEINFPCKKIITVLISRQQCLNGINPLSDAMNAQTKRKKLLYKA